VEDDYDLPGELAIRTEHALNGTDEWSTSMLGSAEYNESSGRWDVPVTPMIGTTLGGYDFRVRATDEDMDASIPVVFTSVLEVINIIPTAPEITISPEEAYSSSTLDVQIVRSARDPDGLGISYRYAWYRNGELIPGLTADTVPSHQIERGENWSVEVRAFDGDDLGPPGFAWKVIANLAPIPKDDLPNPIIDEDTVDDETLNLASAFEDPDRDKLTWSLDTVPQNMTIDIDPETGKVTITPKENWSGDEVVTFVASDGELFASQTVTILVNPINDAPTLDSVDGEPPPGDTTTYTIDQDEELVITYSVSDIEGDDVMVSVNSTLVHLDDTTGEIRFTPTNDQVGTHRILFSVWDTGSTLTKRELEIIIIVQNLNDPPSDPSIIDPENGAKYKVNESFDLSASCSDPDIQHGQELNYTWSSNISGIIGYGPGSSVTLMEPGTHLITLTVTDGEYETTATVELVIEPLQVVGPSDPSGGDDDDEGSPFSIWLVLGIVLVLAILATVFMVVSRRKAAVATEAEAEETRVDDKRTEDKSEDDVQDGVSTEMPERAVEEPPQAQEDVMTLFGRDEGTEEPIMSEEEREVLRIDSMKRKYHNAIGNQMYGIPSKELADWDWIELAAALATGSKDTSEEGVEITEVEGRWYYSDLEDPSTFLREHGVEPEGEPEEDDVPDDNEELLKQLEKRFIKGEISEEAYDRLRKKYGED
jgi:uncharacterized membrane protein